MKSGSTISLIWAHLIKDARPELPGELLLAAADGSGGERRGDIQQSEAHDDTERDLFLSFDGEADDNGPRQDGKGEICNSGEGWPKKKKKTISGSGSAKNRKGPTNRQRLARRGGLTLDRDNDPRCTAASSSQWDCTLPAA